MGDEQIRAKILAAVYLAVAELGPNKAAELVEAALRQIKDDQWRGPANR